MTRWKAGAGLLTVALLAAGPVVTPAAADPVGDPVPQKDGNQALGLEVDTMTPRVITSNTPKLTITGRITNTGDRRVDDIQVKVQRGEPVESDAQLSDLSDVDTDSASSPFVDVADELDRGDSVQFTVTVAIRGAEQSLALSEPGVYPALVNVNGKQEYSGRARLAAVVLPLPVLSVPGGKPATHKPSTPGLTFLWPILDTQPRRLPTTDGQVVLTDDSLADSLSVSGRLFGLVNSVNVAAASNSTLLRSMCFAVDPDLLQTVDAMTRGYRVRTAGGGTVAGKGATVAKEWLTRLRELTHGQCVIAVPYADADLVALSRSGAVDLSSLAMGSSTVVAELLDPVQPAKDLYWPAGGTLDQRTLVDVTAAGPATVLADPGHLRSVKGKAPYEITGLQTAHPARALPTDPLLSRTLVPGRGSGALQNGMAALVYRTMFDQRASDQLIVAPPRRWTASAAELSIYLDLAQQLFDDGYATPQSLTHLTSGANRGTTVGMSYLPQDTAKEVPRAVTANAVRINGTRRDLLNAMVDDNTTNVDPNQLLAPIQYGLLRGVSTAWRGHPERASAWVEYANQQLAALCGRVVVKDTGRPLTLASGDSPIPVHVSNGLPVAIIVRIHLTATAGLRPVPATDIRIPPQSARSQYVSAEVIRAGRFILDASLTTRGGTQLGSTVRMEATSTSVGVITVAITGVAGGVLVLLVVIRLFRRVRAARAGRKDGTKDEVPVDV